MEFQLGAQVRTGDDDHLGELTRVVYNPDSLGIDRLVVQSVRIGEREVQVPLESVASTDDGVLKLSLSEDEFEALDDFSYSRNVAPPPDRDFAQIDPEDELAPGSEVPPIGAATGIESIAYIPIIEEEIFVPTGDGVVDRATEVWATDGLLGHVRAVISEQGTGQIQELIVRHGTVFTQEMNVPVRYIEAMRLDTVVLNVEQSAVYQPDSA